jgi:predicted transcriptional regulator
MASIAQSMADRDRDRDRDESSGQFTDEYPRELFLEAIEAESGMAATGNIADRVGCAHDTAYKKLNRMEECGLVESQKYGNALVWSVPDA